MSKVLVIAVHPDDETLGCGGTLLKHQACGDEIFWLIVTSINAELGYSADQIQTRDHEIEEVSKAYGFSETVRIDYPTTQLDRYPLGEIVKKLSIEIARIQPDILYLPFCNDVHSDHKIVFEASFSCTKTFRYPFIKKVYMMETLSETDYAPSIPGNSFTPNTYVDVSPYFDRKIEILKLYPGEIGLPPFPRSLEIVTSLASLRGSQTNCSYAEAFILLKEIR